mmetsp:Transcript_28784/g.42286  ORF Transcript_28784/g.42286 Transcript_28784/m.42286 type:complete len:236 (-) Transcript_28784:234-941(-)
MTEAFIGYSSLARLRMATVLRLPGVSITQLNGRRSPLPTNERITHGELSGPCHNCISASNGPPLVVKETKTLSRLVRYDHVLRQSPLMVMGIDSSQAFLTGFLKLGSCAIAVVCFLYSSRNAAWLIDDDSSGLVVSCVSCVLLISEGRLPLLFTNNFFLPVLPSITVLGDVDAATNGELFISSAAVDLFFPIHLSPSFLSLLGADEKELLCSKSSLLAFADRTLSFLTAVDAVAS